MVFHETIIFIISFSVVLEITITTDISELMLNEMTQMIRNEIETKQLLTLASLEY